jgi:hypothetical protein
MDDDFTRHARKRAQARAISAQVIGLVVDHADREKSVGSGVYSFMVTKRTLDRLKGVPRNVREKMRGVVVLRAEDNGQIVSAFHADGPNARWYWRH